MTLSKDDLFDLFRFMKVLQNLYSSMRESTTLSTWCTESLMFRRQSALKIPLQTAQQRASEDKRVRRGTETVLSSSGSST